MGQRGGGPGRIENLAGIKNPAIDKLIDKVIFATDHETLIAATMRLTACCSPIITSSRNGSPS